MGDLTQVFNLPVGGGIGQIPEPNPESANLLYATKTGTGGGVWSVTGSANNQITSGEQWNAGTDGRIITTNNGSQGFITNNGAVATLGQKHAIQCEVSVDKNFTSLSAVQISPACRLEVVYSNGGNRTDSVDINPASGAIVAINGSIADVTITPFIAHTQGGKSLQMVRIAFVSNPPPGSVAVINFYPRSDTANAGAVGNIICGSFQFERNDFATSFISSRSTGANGSQAGFSPLGVTPRYATDRTIPSRVFANSVTYEQGVDNGTIINVQVAGKIVTLPILTSDFVGEWAWIVNSSGGIITVNAFGFTGLGLAPGTNTINLPITGFNSILVMCETGAVWRILAAS